MGNNWYNYSWNNCPNSNNSDSGFSDTTSCTHNNWTYHFGNNSRGRMVDIWKNQANNLTILLSKPSVCRVRDRPR
jgi:hypothetical protein